ncbi:PTS lactose transporter subunit IIB [Rhizomonospora bruguierae]|uniref:PTS lactose transporter subunit IIB n=1 Tax=Rhizomonospora bruguierae TaxID=1581705 RepID=UPI001BD1B7C1|nr:PTS lactose transporter subunit IIB [Micromonospora sp. NBRC 107566]
MPSIKGNDIHKVVVACDAGMGSSVMLASTLRRQLSRHSVTVEHTPVNDIPADADVVVTHVGLADRARASAPDKVIVPIRVFLGDPAINTIIMAVQYGGDLHG